MGNVETLFVGKRHIFIYVNSIYYIIKDNGRREVEANNLPNMCGYLETMGQLLSWVEAYLEEEYDDFLKTELGKDWKEEEEEEEREE